MSEWIHSRLVPFIPECEVWLGGGIVRSVRRDRSFGTILFTDCRHPLQNVWCDQDKIMAWRLKDESPLTPPPSA